MKKIVLLALLCASLFATSSQTISFQGKLLDNNGVAVTGTKSIAYELYPASSGGSTLKTWSAQPTVVQNGVYSSELDVSDINLATASNLYLAVIIEGQPLTPRIHLTSSAFAQVATTANYAATAGTVKGTTYTITDTGAASLNSLNVSGTVTADIVIGTVWQ